MKNVTRDSRKLKSFLEKPRRWPGGVGEGKCTVPVRTHGVNWGSRAVSVSSRESTKEAGGLLGPVARSQGHEEKTRSGAKTLAGADEAPCAGAVCPPRSGHAEFCCSDRYPQLSVGDQDRSRVPAHVLCPGTGWPGPLWLQSLGEGGQPRVPFSSGFREQRSQESARGTRAWVSTVLPGRDPDPSTRANTSLSCRVKGRAPDRGPMANNYFATRVMPTCEGWTR